MNGEPRNRLHNIGAADSVAYYNAFVKRYDDTTNPIIIDQPAQADSSSLFVIDVQDDFILLPPGIGNPHGRFCVEDGINMTNELGSFIVGNMAKFSKIVFSRDTHTVDHCSFGPNGGPFPNHCVANHVGSKFHKDILLSQITGENGKKVDVIFKGCTQTTDSFGAVPYSKEEGAKKLYSEKRQLGKCSLDGFTGGKYLKDKTRNFEDYPFTGIPQYSQVDEKLCPKSTTENIGLELGEAFQIGDLFPGQTDGVHNIYVVGVAGDYCVKDTAINIMNSLTNGKVGNVTINVYVLQPYVRYGFLPIQFLGGKNVYKNSAVVNPKANYTNIKDNKDINQYVYQYSPDFKKVLLTQAQITENADAIQAIIPFDGRNFDAAKASNPKLFCSFLSPVKDIITDYRTAGVKMLLDIPEGFTRISSGGRRKKTRRHRTRRAKKTRGRSRRY